MIRNFCITFTIAWLLTGCIVKAQEQKEETHPMLSDEQWIDPQDVSLPEFTDPDGTKIKWDYGVTYQNIHKGWTKSVHAFFGETVLKIYADAQGDALPEIWIQIESDGQWQTLKTGNLGLVGVTDDAGRVIALTIIVRDDNGNEIMRREVKRKE